MDAAAATAALQSNTGQRILHGAELIDLSIAPEERRAQRRQRVLRVGIPVISVALLIGAILGIALYSYESNRRGASVLSGDLLRSLETRISTEVTAYLTPAPNMAQFARQAIGAGTFVSGEGIERTERFGQNLLQSYDQFASFYVADGKGQFLMISRVAGGGTETKLITIAPDGTRQVRLIRRDPVGQSVSERDVQDDFDPRTRPWYKGAVSARGLYLTEVYAFFTERTPGITTALPLMAGDGQVSAVFGIDITLAALSEFLKGIDIGKTGRAMIIDAEGRLIAFPEPERILREENGTLVARRLDELGDLALTRAFNRLRVEGPAHGTVEVDGERIIFASAALPIAGQKNWSALIVVPEKEVIGFVATNNRTALLLSLSVIGIAALLAWLLVRQGLRADRNARLVKDRQENLEAQSRAFAALADSASLFDPADRRGTCALAESLADATRARRISVWRLTHGDRTLLCADCFDREARTHTPGVELHRAELTQLWAALCEGGVDVADAAQDPRTSALYQTYLRPLGVQSLMAVPIKRAGEVVGSIWLEDLPPAARRTAGIESFARTVAHVEAVRIVAPTLDHGEEPVPPPTQEKVVAAGPVADASDADEAPADRVVPATEAARRETAVDTGRQEALWQNRSDPDAAEVFPRATILTVLVTDGADSGNGRSPADGDQAAAANAAADMVACALEEAAERLEIPYLKVLGNCVVAAAGFSGDAAQAGRTIARAALALREASDQLASRLQMGIDTGVVLGTAVGSGRHCYNLWGAAAKRAAEMAQTAPPGGIQVTAFAYRHLSSEFLLRPRGTFYVHPEGETAIYLLAGRI
jgi:class 3 adenylate cyclase